MTVEGFLHKLVCLLLILCHFFLPRLGLNLLVDHFYLSAPDILLLRGAYSLPSFNPLALLLDFCANFNNLLLLTVELIARVG